MYTNCAFGQYPSGHIFISLVAADEKQALRVWETYTVMS